MEPQLLRGHEVAELLGLGRSTVFRMIAAGELPAVKYGRSVRVPRAALEAWLERLSDEALERVLPQERYSSMATHQVAGNPKGENK